MRNTADDVHRQVDADTALNILCLLAAVISLAFLAATR